MSARTATAAAAAPELVITRDFAAPRALVYAAWTRPEHLARWWGPEGFVNIAWQMDVRPGGTWFRRMQAPDGTLMTKRGVYREVVPPARLVFTYLNEYADGTRDSATLVTVTFEERGAGTRLTLRHTGFESAELRAGHADGWSSCFERFAEFLAVVSA